MNKYDIYEDPKTGFKYTFIDKINDETGIFIPVPISFGINRKAYDLEVANSRNGGLEIEKEFSKLKLHEKHKPTLRPEEEIKSRLREKEDVEKKLREQEETIKKLLEEKESKDKNK